MTSNIIDIQSGILITSPELKHNFLLSSNTVFVFSIQTGSMGPSNINHFLLGDSDVENCLHIKMI